MVSLVLANLKALQAWAMRAEEWALESPKPTTSNGTSTTNNSKSNEKGTPTLTHTHTHTHRHGQEQSYKQASKDRSNKLVL